MLNKAVQTDHGPGIFMFAKLCKFKTVITEQEIKVSLPKDGVDFLLPFGIG